jgi:hypothetical protein
MNRNLEYHDHWSPGSILLVIVIWGTVMVVRYGMICFI